MSYDNFKKDLHRLAGEYAKRPDIVQTAGGNVSAKVDPHMMLIKASGRKFSEVTPEGGGVVPVHFTSLRDYMTHASSQDDEAAHIAAVRSSTHPDAAGQRPSMEVWFHTILPTYVLHTHSVYVNVLVCAEGGSKIAGDTMRKAELPFHAFSYYNPGFELGEAMSKALSGLESMPPVMLLENHGIIVAADTAEGCIELHEAVERAIKNELGIEAPFEMGELSAEEKKDFDRFVLFPDQAIYPDDQEIRAAHRYILAEMRRSGLKPRGIKEKDVAALLGMDAEKYRKSLRS